MHRYRNRHSQSSRSKRDVKVEVWIFFSLFLLRFFFARFNGSDAWSACRAPVQARFGRGTLGLAVPSFGERKRVRPQQCPTPAATGTEKEGQTAEE
jgi:hypothetical protein